MPHLKCTCICMQTRKSDAHRQALEWTTHCDGQSFKVVKKRLRVHTLHPPQICTDLHESFNRVAQSVKPTTARAAAMSARWRIVNW